MSFVEVWQKNDFAAVGQAIETKTAADVRRALGHVDSGLDLEDLAALLSPAAAPFLEEMAQISQRRTIARFGRVMQLYAPLYLTNICANICTYCGFSAQNRIPRKALKEPEILADARVLQQYGFDHVLLVTGESNRYGAEYLQKAFQLLRPFFSSLSMEVQPLDEGSTKANVEDSKRVVAICTKYAQKGMFNIFMAVFFGTLACAFIEPFFFIGYLISLAIVGLYQAVFMANAGGAWDNAKKIVETELRAKGTPLHDAAVVGDTVGDPFKDTSSVAMNPIIKFTTLFGLLAVEMAVGLVAQGQQNLAWTLAAAFLALNFFFVYRSFYGMRIEE